MFNEIDSMFREIEFSKRMLGKKSLKMLEILSDQ